MLQVEIFSVTDVVKDNIHKTTEQVAGSLKEKINNWIATKLFEVVDIKITSNHNFTGYSNTPAVTMTATIIYKK